MRFRWLASLAFVAIVGSAAAQPVKPPIRETPHQQPPTWPSLQRFSGDAEFLQYVRNVAALRDAELPAVDPGHHEIEHHDVGPALRHLAT